MATKISIVSLSIATAIVAILLIQTAFRGSNIHALGQAGVSGMDLVTRNPPRPPLTQIFKQVELLFKSQLGHQILICKL
ncbi:MAG: hypothetical protein WCC17_06840 [Candidatus Nitrosopolaris sp.]